MDQGTHSRKLLNRTQVRNHPELVSDKQSAFG